MSTTSRIESGSIYVGIDPGKSGGVGLLDAAGGFIDAFDLPYLDKDPDIVKLYARLRELPIATIAIEYQQAMARPGRRQGIVGTFTLGRGYGLLLAMARFLPDARLITPRPATWKRQAGIPAGSDKEASRQLALRLWPESVMVLKYKKNEGRAEALLLADRARKT